MEIIDQVFWWVGTTICACGVAVFIYYCVYFCLDLCRLVCLRETRRYVRRYIHLYIRFRRFVQKHGEVNVNDLCPHCKGSGVTERRIDEVREQINQTR